MNEKFNELIKRISSELGGICYRLGRRFNFIGQDDLLQEARLHLWRLFQGGILEDKTDSYILQGCFFHLQNYLRKIKQKRPTLSLEGDFLRNFGEEYRESKIASFSSDSNFVLKLDQKLLVETICNNGLTDREKKVLYYCAQGLTTREIGQHLEVSHVAIIKIKARIKEKCAKYLDKHII